MGSEMHEKLCRIGAFEWNGHGNEGNACSGLALWIQWAAKCMQKLCRIGAFEWNGHWNEGKACSGLALWNEWAAKSMKNYAA